MEENLTPIAYPPPYRGQRDDLPLSILQSPYAEWVENYNLDTGEPTLRTGDELIVQAGVARRCLNLSTYGGNTGAAGGSNAQKLFMCTDDSSTGITWYDISSGSLTSVHNAGGGTTGNDDEIHTLFFNNYLMFFGESSLLPANQGPQYYNGSTWGALGYTYPFSIPFGGAAYKRRAYIINQYSTKYAYSGIDAITGATTEVDLATQIQHKGFLYGIRPIALSAGIQAQTVLAFVFSTGEILVYSGSYPNSANWSQVARFQIGEPIYYNAFIDMKGDSYVITYDGLVSLRTLFLGGETVALQQALTTEQPNRWRQVISAQATNQYIYVKGVHDQLRDRLVINIPQYVERSDSSRDLDANMRFVYSFKTKSFWEQKRQNYSTAAGGAGGLAYFEQEVYFGGGTLRAAFKMEGKTGYTDDQHNESTALGIPYKIRTTPLPTQKFGVNMIQGVEMIVQTDLYDETEFKLVGNFGTTETTAQTIPDQGSSISIPLLNVGILANYVQLDISGTSTSASTVGQVFKAFNIWVEKGGLR